MWKAEDKYSRDSITVRNEALCGLSTLPGYDHGQLPSYYQGNSEAILAAVADLIYHSHFKPWSVCPTRPDPGEVLLFYLFGRPCL